MAERRDITAKAGTVTVVHSDADDGDFQIVDPRPDLEQRRRSIVDAPWNWIRQVHGNTVLVADGPGRVNGAEADGLLTTALDSPVAVTTADCAPVVLVADYGVAVVHAGWRGLEAGIVERAGEMLTAKAGDPVVALLGPCIHPGGYEFGQAELDLVVARYGPNVIGRTDTGGVALDMPSAVAQACVAAGWPRPTPGPCTSGPRYYSHRTRGEQARLTTVAWIHRTTP